MDHSVEPALSEIYPIIDAAFQRAYLLAFCTTNVKVSIQEIEDLLKPFLHATDYKRTESASFGLTSKAEADELLVQIKRKCIALQKQAEEKTARELPRFAPPPNTHIVWQIKSSLQALQRNLDEKEDSCADSSAVRSFAAATLSMHELAPQQDFKIKNRYLKLCRAVCRRCFYAVCTAAHSKSQDLSINDAKQHLRSILAVNLNFPHPWHFKQLNGQDMLRVYQELFERSSLTAELIASCKMHTSVQ